MDNKTVYIVAIIILLFFASLTGMYFITKSSIPVKTEIHQIKDTVFHVTIQPVYIDTTRATKVIVMKPYADSSKILELIQQRDSIAKLLVSKNVAELAKLDTVLKPLNDTVSIEYDEYRDRYNKVDLRLSKRDVVVQKELVFIPPPERKWYDNPYISIPSSILLGGVFGYMARGK